ncbi:ArsR/SmtB family transcription factor [Paenibacillus xerothermodurans]|uniref:Transcriptional regulator n=1 Tax=Paenibacillus xerothermodurans TaxID=1977292 RepID=A0A2W1NQP8_PAEXE|nr:helix-turn-helix domain-containing protein [Paenibacillus xerothermodurans]PZE20056.1 transcriptional regulator [Paenibacillus xerothermodurans]
MKIERDYANKEKLNRVLTTNIDDFLNIAKALSTDLRTEIFKTLLHQSMNVMEIAERFSIPASTAAINVRKLEEAGLIQTEMVPGTRGTQKVCTAVYSRIVVDFSHLRPGSPETTAVVSIPIGHFVDSHVSGPCGLLSEHSIIGEMDEPRSFFEPERISAQLIWFRRGYLEYRFPNRVPRGAVIENLELSMELCSEAPLFNLDWPSDITLWINGKELGSWTSPGDFGGERGILTPAWWGSENTQYGLLKTWRVNSDGSFIDGRGISNVTIPQLELDDKPYLTVRIGIKPDAHNDGGINLFGSRFGNYETDLKMKLDFVNRNEKKNAGDDKTW